MTNQAIPQAPMPPLPPAAGGRTPGRLRPVRRTPRFASLRTIGALILREMSTSYGRSPGGYLWAILEPSLALAGLVVIFSLGFRNPALGTNFAIFYASGLLPFFTFSVTSMKTAQSITFSMQLLAYPRVTFLDALLARFILAALTQFLISYLILFFILSVYDTRTILNLPRILSAFGMAAALGLGVGTLNCVLMSRYAIWHSVWSVVTRPLVLISGVIFLTESIPQPYRGWLEWNPLVHVVGQSRRGFYHSYVGEFVSPTYVMMVAVVCGATGLLFLRRYFRDNLEL